MSSLDETVAWASAQICSQATSKRDNEIVEERNKTGIEQLHALANIGINTATAALCSGIVYSFFFAGYYAGAAAFWTGAIHYTYLISIELDSFNRAKERLSMLDSELFKIGYIE